MDPFWLKLALSFAVGGLYIAFTVWVSERFGSRIGGLLIGLPSTSLVSLLFIVWTQNLQVALAAVPIIPAAFAANTLFLCVFLSAYERHKEGVALAAAFVVWFGITLPLVLLPLDNIYVSLALALLFFAISLSYLRRFPHSKLPRIDLPRREFMLRSVFAGIIVALAVFLAKELGPLWGGLFASFPAAYTSSLLMLSRKHGVKFAASVGRSMPYGSIGAVVFFLVFSLTAMSVGLWFSIISAGIASVLTAYIFYRFILV